MEEYLKYIIVSIVILVLDFAWIVLNMKMYSQSVSVIQKSSLDVNYYAAFFAYVVVIFASLYIAIPFTKQHIKQNDGNSQKLLKSFIYGGAVGFAIYAIYNFTSMAIYKNYEFKVALIDTVWGTLLNTIIVLLYLII